MIWNVKGSFRGRTFAEEAQRSREGEHIEIHMGCGVGEAKPASETLRMAEKPSHQTIDICVQNGRRDATHPQPPTLSRMPPKLFNFGETQPLTACQPSHRPICPRFSLVYRIPRGSWGVAPLAAKLISLATNKLR